VNEREQFGRPIGKFQAIQQQLAVGAEWSAMAAMAAQLAMAGPGVQLLAGRVAAAKQVAGTAADTCANVAHAVHGAIGVTAEYDLQLYTRRLWSWAADFGSSLYWATQLGETVLASGDALIWDEVVKLSVA
jgi:acyl-CoA dehydrogenase